MTANPFAMTGKENTEPKAAEAQTAATGAEKRKTSEGGHVQGDKIGPGDEKKGVAEVGWKLPCACTVLKGEYSTSSFTSTPTALCTR